MNHKPAFNFVMTCIGLLATTLPGAASATVVNIDSLANRIPWDQLASAGLGTAGRNPASYASQVPLTLGPGTYAFSFVGGAWNPWGQDQPAASCAQTLDCGSGIGWITTAAFDSGSGTPIVNLGTGTRWFTPALSLADAQAQAPSIHTFAVPTTLRLYVADSVYDEVGQFWWNQGAVSLNIAAVPEPASSVMLLAGLSVIGLRWRRSRRDAGTADG